MQCVFFTFSTPYSSLARQQKRRPRSVSRRSTVRWQHPQVRPSSPQRLRCPFCACRIVSRSSSPSGTTGTSIYKESSSAGGRSRHALQRWFRRHFGTLCCAAEASRTPDLSLSASLRGFRRGVRAFRAVSQLESFLVCYLSLLFLSRLSRDPRDACSPQS